MDIPFFYEPYSNVASLDLNEANVHHITHVLRMKPTEKIMVTNGEGEKCLCTITEISKRNCLINVDEIIQHVKPKRHLHLAISFTKNPSRMEWLLEKATEMGIEEITPLITERSEKNFFKQERFEKIIQSAMLQSQQCFLPVLNNTMPFTNIMQQDLHNKVIAHCMHDEKKKPALSFLHKQESTLILIGPEGDFTPDEITMAMENNFIPVSLGSTRLRTETAGMYVCALYNSIQS